MTTAALVPFNSTIIRSDPTPKSALGRIHSVLIEDERRLLEYIRGTLLSKGGKVTAFWKSVDALTRLKAGLRPDVVIIDADRVGHESSSILANIREIYSSVPIVLLSSSYDIDHLVDAARIGGVEIILKPFDGARLVLALQRITSVVKESTDPEEREIPLSDNRSFVFSSDAMKRIFTQCVTVARVDIPVLILGESGTGKEILAQFIHKMSPNANRTFLKVNCAAMPADLLESELFGYEQGAFTGAVKSKPGKFELCNNGTILLDEIGEMPPSLQAKLLQVLQDGSFSRLGGRTTVKVDVRVIAATNIDMKAAIAERRFREDLYYRLNGCSLRLPPLRDRREEIPILIRYFVRKLADKYARQPVKISDELLRACVNYSWPGNLRELENFVKRLLVLDDEKLMLSELPAVRPSVRNGPVSVTSGHLQSQLKDIVRNVKGEAETQAIAEALIRSNWNRRRAAQELNISYKAMLYKIRQYALVAPSKLAPEA